MSKITFSSLFLCAFLMGCQPRDVDPRFGTLKSSEVGGLVQKISDIKSPSVTPSVSLDFEEQVNEIGKQLSTCSGGTWNDLAIYDKFKPENVWANVYSGERVAIHSKDFSCHKVGVRVLLQSASAETRVNGRRENKSNFGEAIITKIVRIKKDNLTPEILELIDLTPEVVPKVIFDNEVSIVFFKYVSNSSPVQDKYLSPAYIPGSAVNLKDLDSVSKEFNLEIQTAQDIQKEGEQLSTCSGKKSVWSDLSVWDVKTDKVALWQKVYNGERVAILSKARNCFQVGNSVKLTSADDSVKDADGKYLNNSDYGRIVVTRLLLVDRIHLAGEILEWVDHTEDSLSRFLKEDEQASIVIFKYVKGSSQHETTILKGELPETPTANASGNTASPVSGGTPTKPNGSGNGVFVGPGMSGEGINIFIDEDRKDVNITVGKGSSPVNIFIGNQPGRSLEPGTSPLKPEVTAEKPKALTVDLSAARLQKIEAINAEVKVVEYSNRKGVLSTCTSKKEWTDYRNFRKIEAKLYAGIQVVNIGKGEYNCYSPETTLNIVSKDDPVARGQIVVKEIFIMAKADLTDELVAATGQTKAEILGFIGDDTEALNVMTFEYVEGSYDKAKEVIESAGQSINAPLSTDAGSSTKPPVIPQENSDIAFRDGEVLSSCSSNFNPILEVSEVIFQDLLSDDSDGKKTFIYSEAPCWEVGALKKLESLSANKDIIQARVSRLERKLVGSLPDVVVQQLGFTTLEELKANLLVKNPNLDFSEKLTLVFVRITN